MCFTFEVEFLGVRISERNVFEFTPTERPNNLAVFVDEKMQDVLCLPLGKAPRGGMKSGDCSLWCGLLSTPQVWPNFPEGIQRKAVAIHKRGTAV